MQLNGKGYRKYKGYTQMKKKVCLGICAAMIFLCGCSPEVGSDAWCEAMDNKPKGDWTANEATDYAKSCIFRSDD
jgi:protein involved in sex pheromone biosynthesis